MRNIRLVFSVLFIMASASLCFSANGEGSDAGQLMSFADQLRMEGDYYRAITEYKRFIFLNSDHKDVSLAEYSMALCYLEGKKYDLAIARFRAISNRNMNSKLGCKALLKLSEAYMAKRENRRAIDVLEELSLVYPDYAESKTAWIKIGKLYLKEKEDEKALMVFSKQSEIEGSRELAEEMISAVYDFRDLPEKSPLLAGALSTIIPGTGQLYVGRKSDAAISFLVNGFLIWATIEAFDKEENVAGGLLLAFESTWYLGNIYNAVNNAEKYNANTRDKFLRNMDLRLGFSMFPDPEGGVFTGWSLNLNF